MASASTTRATIDDLYREEGKAELVGGRIIRFMGSGQLPSTVAFNIASDLRAHEKSTGRGKAYADGVSYTVPELHSGRESFGPDASYYDGPNPANPMRFIEGAPNLGVEVRSENDYGDAAELAMAAKRKDYFEAGPWWCGTSIRWQRRSRSTAPPTRRSQWCFAAAMSPMRSRRCRGGA